MITLMNFNGFKARVMEAERLTGEEEFGLPPGSPLPVHSVREFKKHPKHWMEEEGCYVIPVNPDKGLWFDWTENDKINTAIIPTVKGCNPITGLKTEGFALERYEKKCPKHNIEFKNDLYCEKCKFKWPAQNYITTPNTLWWDGFRANDGVVRQFFFTADMMRDIAKHLIGKENTVPAFGFAFYAPKVKRHDYAIHSGGSGWNDDLYFDGTGQHHLKYATLISSGACEIDLDGSSTTTQGLSSYTLTSGGPDVDFKLSNSDVEFSAKGDLQNSVNYMQAANKGDLKVKASGRGLSAAIPCSASPQLKKASKKVYQSRLFEMKKEVAVGAGAKIMQALEPDPYELKSWKDEPNSIMRIYFIFKDEFEHWKSFGMKDCGMLDGLPVG